MAENDTDDAMLGTFFAAAQRTKTEMPVGLAERMRADAAMVQDEFLRARAEAAAPAAGRDRAPGLLAQLWSALGGWPALSGMTAACAAGVWLGVSPPTFLPDPVGLVTQSTQQSDLDVLNGNYALFTLLQEDG